MKVLVRRERRAVKRIPRQAVPGEYNKVVAQSADVPALLRAHQTPISRRDAEQMLLRLADRYNVTGLRIKWGAKGGRAGVLKFRTNVRAVRAVDGARVRVPVFYVYPYVNLPTQSMTLGGPWWDYFAGKSLLRVGLVLHEFAHVVVVARDFTGGHGSQFVAALDGLVSEWTINP